jgi:hypothetical protein
MTTQEFNNKYKDYLVPKYYGLTIQDDSVIAFLDNIFIDLTKLPSFKYYQIKMKFGQCRFYSEGITRTLEYLIEQEINKLTTKK